MPNDTTSLSAADLAGEVPPEARPGGFWQRFRAHIREELTPWKLVTGFITFGIIQLTASALWDHIFRSQK